MHRTIKLVALLLFLCSTAIAQEVPRIEVFGGYSHLISNLNATSFNLNGATVGVGMGQVNRVDSCRLAVSRAGADRARGAVAASDAFFPFPDGPRIALDAGATSIVQPGGSKRDQDVIDAVEKAGATMVFTHRRHFRH